VFHRFGRIVETISPDLQRPDLRNAVLDVVERVQENVQLPIPPCHPLLFEFGPVHASLEALPQPEPLRISCVGVSAFSAGVEPGLEGIYRRDVHQAQKNVLEMLQPGTQRVFRRKVPHRLDQMRCSEQLH
jgi:hypothetical protein